LVFSSSGGSEFDSESSMKESSDESSYLKWKVDPNREWTNFFTRSPTPHSNFLETLFLSKGCLSLFFLAFPRLSKGFKTIVFFQKPIFQKLTMAFFQAFKKIY
jgi:hypothetical protein